MLDFVNQGSVGVQLQSWVENSTQEKSGFLSEFKEYFEPL